VVESYSYDPLGNRTALNNTLTGQTLAIADYQHDGDCKLLQAGTSTYQYDADGRLIKENRNGSITDYHYNMDGTLDGVNFPDGRKITYLHDHQGRRIARAVDGTRTHAWLYGKGLMPVAEFDGSGNLRSAFVYAVGATPHRMTRSGVTYHIISDHLGSPRLVLDATAAIVKQVDYDAYGNALNDTNPGFDLTFGFAGGMTDPDHELIRFGARDYSPAVGRWTAKDPILFKGGKQNLYGYVNNDPIDWGDPFGLKKLPQGEYIISDLGENNMKVMNYDFKIGKKIDIPDINAKGDPNKKPTFENLVGHHGNWWGADLSGGKKINPGGIGPVDAPCLTEADRIAKQHDIYS